MNEDRITDILLEIEGHLGAIREALKNHTDRLDKVERVSSNNKKYVHMALGAVGLFGLLASTISLLGILTI